MKKKLLIITFLLLIIAPLFSVSTEKNKQSFYLRFGKTGDSYMMFTDTNGNEISYGFVNFRNTKEIDEYGGEWEANFKCFWQIFSDNKFRLKLCFINTEADEYGNYYSLRLAQDESGSVVTNRKGLNYSVSLKSNTAGLQLDEYEINWQNEVNTAHSKAENTLLVKEYSDANRYSEKSGEIEINLLLKLNPLTDGIDSGVYTGVVQLLYEVIE